MIPRYTHPDMGRIWGDQRKYDTWLRVEVAAAEAMAATGLIPAEAARAIAACDGVLAERIDEIEQTTQHDVIAFTTAVAERVGPSARWLHFGLTSSDVLETCFGTEHPCDGWTLASGMLSRKKQILPPLLRTLAECQL